MRALGPGDVTSPGFRGCSLSPHCRWEVKERQCGSIVKAPSGRFFLMVWALGSEKGPPCSHSHFCQPCPQWRAPPAPSYLGAGAHVCLFFPALHFALLCSLPLRLCLFLELPAYILQAAPCLLELRTKYNLCYHQRRPYMSVPFPSVCKLHRSLQTQREYQRCFHIRGALV